MYNVGNYIPDVAQQGITDVANDGILSSMYNFGSNTMDFLKNESVGKALSAGTNAFSAFNQYNQAKDAKKMANEQMKMAKDRESIWFYRSHHPAKQNKFQFRPAALIHIP